MLIIPQIATAWEILSVPETRSTYDNEYRRHHRTRECKTAPTNNQNWTSGAYSAQSSRNEQSKTESNQLRREHEDWIRIHNMKIDTTERTLNTLKRELENLKRQDQQFEEQLTFANSMWTKLNPFSTARLSEEE